jgi:hypothetical protein
MTLGSQEIVSDKNCSVRPPEIDFALVLSRVIGSIENDPAQLRNAIYELARIKLRQEAWQKSPPINLLKCPVMTWTAVVLPSGVGTSVLAASSSWITAW